MASAVSWSTFKKAIGTNPRARFSGTRSSKAAMVYLYLPKHPDSDKRGLWEVLAVPSPTYFMRCPKHFVETDGKSLRGYAEFFRATLKMRSPDGKKIFNQSAVKAIIPDAYEIFDSKSFKADVTKKNLSDDVKQYNKVKHLFNPIAGNGDPIGARNEKDTIYSLPA